MTPQEHYDRVRQTFTVTVDGPPGSGKSTLSTTLRSEGYQTRDGGLPSKLVYATGEVDSAYSSSDFFLILRGRAEIFHDRLMARCGRARPSSFLEEAPAPSPEVGAAPPPSEETLHTLGLDFLKVAESLPPTQVCVIYSDGPIGDLLAEVLRVSLMAKLRYSLMLQGLLARQSR